MNITSITRFLKKPKARRSTINFSIYHNNQRFRLSSGLSILTEHWNVNTQKMKSSFPKKYFYENQLSEIESKINLFLMKSESLRMDKSEITESLKKIISNEPIKNLEVRAYSFLETLNDFIDQRLNSNIYTNGTAKNYIPLKMLCIKYEDKYGKIEFDNVSDRFMEKFYYFLINENEAIHNSYAKKQLSNLKTFLNDCFKKGIIDNTLFREFRPKNNKKSTKVDIRLDSAELSIVESYVPETKPLEKTKDLFLIQCYTGLRVSDLMKLDATSINDGKTLIKISTQKTDATAHIPISKKLHVILDKYDYDDFPRYKDTEYNKNIKVLCKKAGIVRQVKTKQYKGSKVINKTYEKWELMTSNIARKTFITHLVEQGFAIEEIKVITGHKKNQTVENYINFTQNELLDRVQKKFLNFN